MNVTALLQKLIDIEKSIGRETDRAILDKVLDAECCLLQLQKEMIANPSGNEMILNDVWRFDDSTEAV
jgi:hypothetical protein